MYTQMHFLENIKDGKVFNEFIKGNDSRKEFFEKIIEVVAFLGGNANDVI